MKLRKFLSEQKMSKRESDGFGQRIEILVERCGGALELSNRSGLSRRVVDNYRNGTSDPSRERLIALARAADVDIGWLVGGIGSPEGQTAQPQNSPSTLFTRDDADLLARLIGVFMSIPNRAAKSTLVKACEVFVRPDDAVEDAGRVSFSRRRQP